MRVTARTFAGHEGLVNIEREVELSGPIHDKGVLILGSYLSALFAHIAPLALSASIVFEQEYHGVEGDSASCAELYVLLSSLSGLPLRQGIAVTGAVNQHGDVLPVGGLNEKIEGWFRVCERAGLDGTQGVLIPAAQPPPPDAGPRCGRCRGARPVSCVCRGACGRGHRVADRTALGLGDGVAPYADGSVLARAGQTLLDYRRACARAWRGPVGRHARGSRGD